MVAISIFLCFVGGKQGENKHRQGQYFQLGPFRNLGLLPSEKATLARVYPFTAVWCKCFLDKSRRVQYRGVPDFSHEGQD
jgi:hypothetical protein